MTYNYIPWFFLPTTNHHYQHYHSAGGKELSSTWTTSTLNPHSIYWDKWHSIKLFFFIVSTRRLLHNYMVQIFVTYIWIGWHLFLWKCATTKINHALIICYFTASQLASSQGSSQYYNTVCPTWNGIPVRPKGDKLVPLYRMWLCWWHTLSNNKMYPCLFRVATFALATAMHDNILKTCWVCYHSCWPSNYNARI